MMLVSRSVRRAFSYKASVVTALGKPLEVVEKEQTGLQAHQVRVAVHNAGINYADMLMAAGKYQVRLRAPFVPGMEGAGEILEVGSAVTKVKAGDRVIALCESGMYSQQNILEENCVIKIPSAMPYTTAAGLAVSYGTAHVGLEYRANLLRGETLLVMAAAGSVGLASVEIGKVMGATVIGASSGSKLHAVKEKGADFVIDYGTENLRDKIKEYTSAKGVDVVMDMVGGSMFDDVIKSVAWDARMVIVGFASGTIQRIPAEKLLTKNCSAVGLFWGPYRTRNPKVFSQSLTQLFQWWEAGLIKPQLFEKVYGLDEVNQAFVDLAERRTTGKVLISTGLS